MEILTAFFKKVRYKLWYYSNRSKFRNFGSGSFVNDPLQINGIYNIYIGERVRIGYKCWLAALPHTGENDCLLQIGNNCSIGNFNHIYATRKIVLGPKVLTADRVYISDNLHGYEITDMAIMDQPIKQLSDVYIGEGTWLGENVCVIGAKIGRNCVIGANAVVTKDIPDYSIAVGIPAKIIKRYCTNTKTWRKTNENGDFI